MEDSNFTVEVTQTQRFFPLSGWGKRRLPTDRPEWADRSGRVFQSKDMIESILPRECEWKSDWKLFVKEGETDKDGWQYAMDFPHKYSPIMAKLDFVRRRFWRRDGAIKPAYADIGIVNCPAFEACILQQQETATSLQTQPQQQQRQGQQPEKRGCMRCSVHLSVLNPARRCSTCNKDFCPRCTKRLADGLWKCSPCYHQDIERRMHALGQTVAATVELESTIRDTISEEAAHWLKHLLNQEMDERKEVQELDKQRSHADTPEQQRLIDKWTKTTEPRQGLLRMSVMSAHGFPITTTVKKIRATIQFPGTAQVAMSDVVEANAMPEFHGFSAQAMIANDLESIIITIEDCTPKSLFSMSEHPIMASVLKLRDNHPGIVHDVSAALVYTERGCATLQVYDPQTRTRVLGETKLTVKWGFEVREVESVGFCSNCGRIKSRCDCK